MKNFLSNLCSSSRTDRVRTLAIDAVSMPSFCRVNMLKLVSILVILLTIGSGNAWGKEGDELAVCQGTGSGYGTRRTLTDSHSVGWVLSTGQSGYLGANNATNHNKVMPTAADLPVVKAQNASATTSTTGYYFYYTSTAISNVGSIVFSYTANSGNNSATAYIVSSSTAASSGSATWSKPTLASGTGLSAQGVSLGTSGTFTFQLSATETSAKYYGIIIVTGTYKRMTAGTITIKEGATGGGCTSEVTITKGSETHGTYDLSGSTVCADGDGGEISASNIEPDDCYEFASITTSASGTPDNTNKKVTGITAATTITVNFQKKTVNTYIDDIQDNGTTEDCGTHDAPSLDDKTVASSGTCAQQHWHFMGWVTAANKANPTDANIITPGTEMTANGTTYYAVWAKGTGGGGFDNTAGGTFKIYADVNGTKYYATGTGSKITASTDISDAADYVFEKQSAGVYYIKTGSDYITYSSSTNLGTSASGYSWTVTSGTKGSWRVYSTATSTRGFIFRSGTGFGGYATSNVTAGGTEYYDLEIDGGYEYSDYICTCCTELGTINGSITLSQSGTSVTVRGWTYTQGSGAAESNINTYDVYLYSDADSYADPIATQTCAYNAKGTGVTFTSLSYGTTYKIKIGATGNTNYCDITPIQVTTINSTSTQTFQLACDVPTNVAASSITASSATVSWDDVATNYQYVLDQSSSDPAGAGTAVNGAHSVDLSTLSPSTTYYFHVRTNCGNSVFSNWATISFNTPAAACSSYSFNYGPLSGESNWETPLCFEFETGTTDTYYIKNFTIPTTATSSTQFYVGWQGVFQGDNEHPSYSQTWNMVDNNPAYNKMRLTLSLVVDGSSNRDFVPVLKIENDNVCGLGAQGTLKVCGNHNNNYDNKYVGFIPAGYALNWGPTQGDWETPLAFTAASNNIEETVWTTDIITLTSTRKAYNYYVGLKTASGNVYSGRSTTTAISGMPAKTGSSTWASNGVSDIAADTRGKFRVWADNNQQNWNCHFVPYYHVTYNGNGATEGSTAASADVSCEGDASARTVKAAANGFTGPAHTTFGGWATSASGAKVYDPNDDIVLTADVELFAIWEPEANATITLNNYTGSAVTTGYYVGDDFTLPTTNSYTCGLKTFVGWSTVAVDSPTKPTAATYYEPGDHVTLGATNTFYAVFADDNSVEDVITLSSTGVSAGTTSYSDWSNVTDQSDAVYAGNSAGGQNASNGSIQLRSNNSNSGVVTTTSGGTATKVVVAWNSNMSQERNIDVYGKNTAYSAASDLYGENQGTLLGSITWTSQTPGTELTITGDYAYIGLRSQSGALYLDDITITWSSGYSNYATTCITYYDINTAVSPAASGSVTLSQSSAPEGGTATATAVPAEGYGFGSWAITGGATLSSSSTNPTTITMGSADATITATFLPKCATPTFSPAGSTYTSAQSVTISSSTTGSTIYYTTDGSDPTTGSSHGTAGDASVTINVSSTTTIKAIAVKSGTNANSDIASATYTIKTGKLFSLVTDASDLAAGDELVIVGYASTTPHVMSTTQNGNNRGMTDTDWEFISSDLFVEEKNNSTVQVITLEGSTGEWYLNVGDDAYLYAAGGNSNNYLRTNTKTTVGDKGKFTISIGAADTYYATVTAQDANTSKNLLQYNSGSKIFSCYSSAQQSIQLYRFANTAPRVNVGTPSGNSFTYAYGSGPSDAQTFTVSGNNLTGNVVITPPSHYQIKNGSGEWGTSAITLTPDGSGAIAVTTISVRLVDGLNAGSYNGDVSFTNNDGLTIPSISLTGTVSKANLNPAFGAETYTITRDVSTSTTFTLTGVPDDYTGTITYTKTNTPTYTTYLTVDGSEKTFTATSSGSWTVTAKFSFDDNYNSKASGVTCTVNAVTRDTYVDNVNSQSVSEAQRTDNGVDPYVSPALDDVSAGSACHGKKTHLLGWATQLFIDKVGDGRLSGAKSDYTEANGFYAVGTTLPAASGATYYAVWGELDE